MTKPTMSFCAVLLLLAVSLFVVGCAGAPAPMAGDEPGATANGDITYTCAGCGDSKTLAFTDATPSC